MYRQTRNYENLNKAVPKGTGAYDIPRILPTNTNADRFIGFNYAQTCKATADVGLHFFLDDYQFTRLWMQPDRYIQMLRRFKCVCSPDFSVYTDFPRAIQIYNHYRKHWLGAYWQMHGIDVIPTISWGDESSFEWCFEGEPKGGMVAVSSVGTQKNRESRELFLKGYFEMLKRLEPIGILFHGSVPHLCSSPSIIPIPPFQSELKERTGQKNHGR